MKELPLEKQFQIMDLLRLRIPERDIARLCDVAKSTVQDYKKHGPPFFRRYSKNPSVESYPASIQEENTWLRQIFQEIVQINDQVINQRNTANRNVEFLQADNSGKDRKIEWLNHLKDENDKTVHQQDETIHELKSRIDQLIKLAQTLVHRDERRDIDGKKILEDLERNKIDLAKANQLLRFSENEIHDVTQERDEFKDTVKRMEREHEFDWLKYLSTIILSFEGGVVFDRVILPKIKDFLLSLIDEYARNTGYSTNPNQPVSVLRPNVHYVHSGATPEIITSSSFLSGAYVNTYEETQRAGYPNQQDGMTQSGIYHINSGMPLGITTSSTLCCSAACPSTYGNNADANDAIIPNMQDGVIHLDSQKIYSEVTLSTNTSIDPSLGVFFNYYTDPLQDAKPINEYTPPPLIIPLYSLSLTSPDNHSDSSLM